MHGPGTSVADERALVEPHEPASASASALYWSMTSSIGPSLTRRALPRGRGHARRSGAGRLAVRHEEERLAAGEHVLHPLVALLAEGAVADGEDLVDEDDRLVEGGDDARSRGAPACRRRSGGTACPCRPRTCGPAKSTISSKRSSIWSLVRPCRPAGEVDVVARRQLAEEAAGQLDERGDPAADRDRALVGEQDAGDHLAAGCSCRCRCRRRGRRPRPRATSKRDVAQRPEGLLRRGVLCP